MENASVHELNFVPLQGAVLCADCEIITESHSGRCRVCGGGALLSLARVLGGPLGPQRAVLLDPAEAEMNRLIEDLIESAYPSEEDADEETAA
ncbi:MAG TPA: hypothetical protein VMS96_08115 [Terriglobales bacterium]|nr:hypothetical protein [Terriglobales bacterium]